MTTLTASVTALTAPASATTLELRSGPHTIAGPGETCLVCGDPLSRGEVYLFVVWAGEAGVAHEDCAEFEANAGAAEHFCDRTAPAATVADTSSVPVDGAFS